VLDAARTVADLPPWVVAAGQRTEAVDDDSQVQLQLRPTALLLRIVRSVSALLRSCLDQTCLPLVTACGSVAMAFIRRVASRATEAELAADEGAEDADIRGLEAIPLKGDGLRLLQGVMWGQWQWPEDEAAASTDGVSRDGAKSGIALALLTVLLQARRRFCLTMPSTDAVLEAFPCARIEGG